MMGDIIELARSTAKPIVRFEVFVHRGVGKPCRYLVSLEDHEGNPIRPLYCGPDWHSAMCAALLHGEGAELTFEPGPI
jgi:hypothetical protein